MTVLKCLWRVLDFCRRLVLNLIFLGVLVAAALIWLFARPNTPAVEPGTLLVLDLDGTVVESDPLRSISADLKSLMKSRGASTRLIDVTEALRFAGSDERIAGVIIKVDGLTKLGLASARTIGSAIEDYKTASGKPVFSWASGYTQAQYAAAAHADVVALHPMGSVMVKGLSGTTLYWGGFLGKLGIGVSVFKAGAFKSAPEAYSLRAPTTDNLIAQEGYLSEAWKVFASDLEDARGLIPGSVDTYLKGLPERLNAGESPAEAAKAAGLITDLMAREAFDETLAKQFGGGNLKNVKTVNFGAYLAETARSRSAAQPGAVAVVLAEGAISSTVPLELMPRNWCSALSEPHPLPQPKHWCCEFRARVVTRWQLRRFVKNLRLSEQRAFPSSSVWEMRLLLAAIGLAWPQIELWRIP